MARLAVWSGRSKHLELVVLRHQLAVLRRQIHRPELADHDRTLFGAIAAALRLSAEVRNAVIVAIICDRGDRYLSTGVFPAE